MISYGWSLKDGFWYVAVDLDDTAAAEAVPDYAPLPTLKGNGISRRREAALAYALEDLAAQLKARKPWGT